MANTYKLDFDKYVIDLLRSDPAMTVTVERRVYSDEPPSPVTVPYVVVRQVGPSNDVNYNGPRRAFTRAAYDIEVVTTGADWKSANDAARRIDELITGQKDATEGGTLVIGAIRTGMHSMVDRINAERINRMILSYNVWVREASIP